MIHQLRYNFILQIVLLVRCALFLYILFIRIFAIQVRCHNLGRSKLSKSFFVLFMLRLTDIFTCSKTAHITFIRINSIIIYCLGNSYLKNMNIFINFFYKLKYLGRALFFLFKILSFTRLILFLDFF